MASVVIKDDDVYLLAMIENMVSIVTKIGFVGHSLSFQLQLLFVPAVHAFELEISSTGGTQVSLFDASPTLCQYRHAIVPLLCAKLTARGFTVSEKRTEIPLMSFTRDGQPLMTRNPLTHMNTSDLSLLETPVANSSRVFPSIESLFATRDVRAKADEVRRKEAKEAFDRATLQFLQKHIMEYPLLEFIETPDRRGYKLRIDTQSCSDGVRRTYKDFLDVMDALQADIGPKEQATCEHLFGGVIAITVLSI